MFEAVGRVVLDDIPDPAVEAADDAVVRVTVSAICGSDLHFLHGRTPLARGDGIGHEAVGVVEAVGADVTRFRPGDRVVVAFTNVCGCCWFCRRGQTQLCDSFANLGAGMFGGAMPGAQAELIRVPVADVNLLAIPDGIDDERALFVGDVMATAYYVASLGRVEPGDTVAVVGAGPLGFLIAQAVKGQDAGRVAVLDREPDRLSLVASIASDVIDIRERNPQTALADMTSGRGADVVLEAVGSTEAFELSIDTVRRGGRVVVAGVYAGESTELQLGVYWARALEVRFAGICPVQAWWQRAMNSLVDGVIDPLPLVSHRLPLSEAPRGYELFDRREATKVLLIP